MMTSSRRLPTNLSRTRTQAMIVPTTMLIAVTPRAAPTVSLIAAQVCGCDSVCQ
jgi:hypothetical protein